MNEQIVTYRVACPRCGEFANLRCFERTGEPTVVVLFSCRNQTSLEHGVIHNEELRDLIPS